MDLHQQNRFSIKIISGDKLFLLANQLFTKPAFKSLDNKITIKINKILQDKKDNQQFLKLIAPKYIGVYVVDLKKISSVIL